MCMSTAPAKFSDTIVYAGETEMNNMLLHMLGYQNTAQSFATAGQKKEQYNFDWSFIKTGKREEKATGNAMVLPIPAKGKMGPENLLDTSNCLHFLKDMENAVRPRYRSATRGGMEKGIASLNSVQVFESGIYTVVLANPDSDSYDIDNAIRQQVPEEKRPEINLPFLEVFTSYYRDWWIAVCCFNNKEAATAHPLLWWYEPMFEKALFAPALDAHDGLPPQLGKQVHVDHTLVVSSHKLFKDNKNFLDVSPVRYRDPAAENFKGFLPNFVMGKQYKDTSMVNGDFVLLVDEVRAGNFRPQRLNPPGA